MMMMMNNSSSSVVVVVKKEVARRNNPSHVSSSRPRFKWRIEALLLCMALCVTTRVPPSSILRQDYVVNETIVVDPTTMTTSTTTTTTTIDSSNTAALLPLLITSQELYESQHALKDHDWEWIVVRINQVSNLPMESMGMDFPDPQVSLHVNAQLPPEIAFSGNLTEFAWPTKWNVPTNCSKWEGLGIVSYIKGTATALHLKIMEQNQVDQNYQLFHETIVLTNDDDDNDDDDVLLPLEVWTNITLKGDDFGIVTDVSILRSSTPLFEEENHTNMHLTEHLIPLENGELASLAYRTSDSNKKAVLYFAGRSDSFAHPHLLDLYFKKKGYDFYALDPRRSGRARRFLKNVHLGNDVDDFSIYYEDVTLALDFIRNQRPHNDKPYELLVAHCHSNGALVLLSYLLEQRERQEKINNDNKNGDDDTTTLGTTWQSEEKETGIEFDGYILNSPFLDWGHVGGSLNEFILKNANVLTAVGGPMELYGHDNTLNDWWTKTWLLYRWNLTWKPIITNSMTLHYAQAVSDLQYRLQQLTIGSSTTTLDDDEDESSSSSSPIYLLGHHSPTLVLSSHSDDILEHLETMELARKLHPHPTVKEFEWHSHDVTKSFTKELNEEANDAIGDWLDDLQVYHSMY